MKVKTKAIVGKYVYDPVKEYWSLDWLFWQERKTILLITPNGAFKIKRKSRARLHNKTI